MFKVVSNLILDEWYKVFLIIVFLGFFPALWFELPYIDNVFAMLFFGGFLAVGVGEMANHQYRTEIVPPGRYGNPGWGTAEGRPRRLCLIGVFLDVLGAALFAGSLYKLYINHF